MPGILLSGEWTLSKTGAAFPGDQPHGQQGCVAQQHTWTGSVASLGPETATLSFTFQLNSF